MIVPVWVRAAYGIVSMLVGACIAVTISTLYRAVLTLLPRIRPRSG